MNYPLANVHPEAIIGQNVVIEAFATIQTQKCHAQDQRKRDSPRLRP